MAETARRPALISALIYRDNAAALTWLEKAFGFEIHEVWSDASGAIMHAEMRHGEGILMIGHEWADWTRSPQSVNGANTQRVFVRLERGIDEHCDRARRNGARIVMEPHEQFYGDRTYMAVDPEGHHWTFAQTTRALSNEEMAAASGLTLRAFPAATR